MKLTYQLVKKEGKVVAIHCRICHMTSHNPSDIKHRYCGMCKEFHQFLKFPAKQEKVVIFNWPLALIVFSFSILVRTLYLFGVTSRDYPIVVQVSFIIVFGLFLLCQHILRKRNNIEKQITKVKLFAAYKAEEAGKDLEFYLILKNAGNPDSISLAEALRSFKAYKSVMQVIDDQDPLDPIRDLDE